MGKRKVLNESALKEIRLAEEGELYGRVIKLLGSDQVLEKCADDITRRGTWGYRLEVYFTSS